MLQQIAEPLHDTPDSVIRRAVEFYLSQLDLVDGVVVKVK